MNKWNYSVYTTSIKYEQMDLINIDFVILFIRITNTELIGLIYQISNSSTISTLQCIQLC